jgi:hypothetical protein
MAIMSKHVDLRPSMVDVGTLNVLICMILTGGQHLEDIKIDCVRTLCQLTCSQDLHEVLIHKRIIVAIVVLTNKRGLVPSTVVDHLAAHALCNLSRSKMSHRSLVEDGGTELLVALILRSQPITPSSVDLSCVVLDSVNALARVGASALMVGALLASGLVEALSSLSPRQLVDPRLSLCASQALAALSRSAAHRRELVARGITTALIGLVRESPTPQAKLLCAEAFRNLSMEHSTRASMVASGVERVLVDLGAILDDRDAEAHCAAALANLSAHASQPKGIVQVLLDTRRRAQHATAIETKNAKVQNDESSNMADLIQGLLAILDDKTRRALDQAMADCIGPHESSSAMPKAAGGPACPALPPPPPVNNKVPVWIPKQGSIKWSPRATFGDENNPVVLKLQKLEN